MSIGNVAVGTVSGGTDAATPLQVTLNASADLAAVETLVEAEREEVP